MKKRILLTGIGGPAAVSFFNSIPRNSFEFFLGDSDPKAGGLSLVPPSNRILLKTGSDESYIENLLDICRGNQINVLVPTLECELLPIAEAIDRFHDIGVRVLCEETETLRICNDKSQLIKQCGKPVFVPRSAIFDSAFNEAEWSFPLFVKPRSSNDFSGFGRIDHSLELAEKRRDETLLIQEYLPGVEFSVDVMANEKGEIIAAVPREGFKNDLAMTATIRTLRNERLEIYAKVIARKIGLKFVANIQFKLDESGEAMVLGVKPYFLGNVGLTVKCGVNIPLLCLQSLLGEELGSKNLPWNELELTRLRHDYYYEFFDTNSDTADAKKDDTKTPPTGSFFNRALEAQRSSFMFMEFATVLKNY